MQLGMITAAFRLQSVTGKISGVLWIGGISVDGLFTGYDAKMTGNVKWIQLAADYEEEWRGKMGIWIYKR